MREAADRHPRVEWRDGTAEETGLPEPASTRGRVSSLPLVCNGAARCASSAASRGAAPRSAAVRARRDATNLLARTATSSAHMLPTTPKRFADARLRFSRRFQTHASRAAAFPRNNGSTVRRLLGRAASSSYLPASGPAAEATASRSARHFRAFRARRHRGAGDGHVRARRRLVTNETLRATQVAGRHRRRRHVHRRRRDRRGDARACRAR